MNDRIKSIVNNKLTKNIFIILLIVVAFIYFILPGLNARDNVLNAISVVMLLIALIPAGLALDNLIDYFTEN